MRIETGIAILVFSIAAMPVLAAPVTWDWQLVEPFDLSREVDIYDVDPDNHDDADIAALKARGVKTICYVSVGTREDYRVDADAFPSEAIGATYGDWPDEEFLDIRRLDALLPIMQARFERCRDMGFDAVEPDNMDVYENESGFDLSADDAIAYVEALAEIAHGLGMEIGQKNVPELTDDLVATLDFIVTESCFIDGWCDAALPYIADGKPVLATEYTDTDVDFAAACAYGVRTGMSFILKDRDLTKSLETCYGEDEVFWGFTEEDQAESDEILEILDHLNPPEVWELAHGECVDIELDDLLGNQSQYTDKCVALSSHVYWAEEGDFAAASHRFDPGPQISISTTDLDSNEKFALDHCDQFDGEAIIKGILRAQGNAYVLAARTARCLAF